MLWGYLIEAYGAVIQTLPFAPLGSLRLDHCLELGYDPQYLLTPHETIYQRLARRGVMESRAIGHHGGLTPAEMMTIFAVMELSSGLP